MTRFLYINICDCIIFVKVPLHFLLAKSCVLAKSIIVSTTFEHRDKLYKTIEDSLKELSDIKEKIKGNDMFGKFSFGLSINTKVGTNESIVSFLAQSDDKSYSASSTDELIKMMRGAKSVDSRV